MQIEVARLGQAVQSFIELVGCLDADTLNPSKRKNWGAREVLIHLVCWHEQYSFLAANAVAGRQQEPPKGPLKTINAEAVTQNIKVPVHELVSRWVNAQKSLARTAEMPGVGDFKIALSKSSKQWPLSELLRMATGHIQKHEMKLRKQLKMSRATTRSAGLL